MIENHEVKGVAVARQPRILPNEMFEDELIEADAVISTLPVWHVLKVVPDLGAARLVRRPDRAPRAGQVPGRVARPLPRRRRAGRHPRPPRALDLAARAGRRRRRASCSSRPRSTRRRRRRASTCTSMGGVIPGAKGTDDALPARDVREVRARASAIWYPGLANPTWRRRHLVFEPSFGVIQKPGLVGMFRPHWRAPNVEGLWFASETFRSRGIGVDRAARAGLDGRRGLPRQASARLRRDLPLLVADSRDVSRSSPAPAAESAGRSRNG